MELVVEFPLSLSAEMLAFLFFIAMLAGFIDAIAGGGGLLTIPALMSAGLPPITALATNKLQACGGSFFASFYFVRNGLVNWRKMKLPLLCAFIGSALGTTAVQQINTDVLKILLPFLMLGIAGYFLFSPKLNDEDKQQLVSPTLFAFTGALGVGFYDGFFGPGTGSFFTLVFVTLAGYGLAKATAHAKLLNFSTNIASLIFFAFAGHVVWSLGLLMLAGQAIGATIGSRMVIQKGSQIIRPLVIIMSLAMSLKLLFDYFA